MNTCNSIKKACNEVGGITALSRGLGITPGAVHQWTIGYRRVPAERCPDIEELTNGVVRAEELRPDVNWHFIRGRAA